MTRFLEFQNIELNCTKKAKCLQEHEAHKETHKQDPDFLWAWDKHHGTHRTEEGDLAADSELF